MRNIVFLEFIELFKTLRIKEMINKVVNKGGEVGVTYPALL